MLLIVLSRIADTSIFHLIFAIFFYYITRIALTQRISLSLFVSLYFRSIEFGQKFMNRCKLKIQFNRHETNTKDIMLTSRFSSRHAVIPLNFLIYQVFIHIDVDFLPNTIRLCGIYSFMLRYLITICMRLNCRPHL